MGSNFSIAFDDPKYLVLLTVVPLMWWFCYRSLTGLGPVRMAIALGLRSVVLTLMVLALAETELVRSHQRLTVIYLLDQSSSIPEAKRRESINYVNESVRRQRVKSRADRAGVIVFGRDAQLEIPPLDDDVRVPMALESLIDPDYSDLAGAMKMAMSLLANDSAGRIVLVTDGNENLGNARAVAKQVVASGIGIDVTPISQVARDEVAVEKVSIASDVRLGQPFEVRVILDHSTKSDPPRASRGKVALIRRTRERVDTLSEQDVELPPGKSVLTMREAIDEADFYTYEVRFTPDSPADDTVTRNNRATSFVHIRGKGQVLLIEDWANRGAYDLLVERLRNQGLEVTLMPSNRLFSSLGDLQKFDTVVLADVPRTSGDDAESLSQFSDEQIEMLTRNTQQFGSGLVMLGGPNSFGAGGWANTELEKAMPVDFKVDNLKVAVQGGLVLVIDRSGSMQGQKLAMCKAAAIAAVNVLGPRDMVGVVTFDSEVQWVVKLQPAADAAAIAQRIDRISVGGGTNMEPGMRTGYRALASVDVGVKHMIVLTDGQTMGAGYFEMTDQHRQLNITTTAVSVGEGADQKLLRGIAQRGGGKFYQVKSPLAIPRVFMREARRVARPLIYEDLKGFAPIIKANHEILGDWAKEFPPVTGIVLTTPKHSPLVEIPVVSPKPAGSSPPILATWNYGLGRTAVLTTDAGKQWATAWTGWEYYDKLFTQIVRWSMRPVNDSGKFTVAADVKDGRCRVVVTALDKDDSFLNFLTMNGVAVGPENRLTELALRQIAPGRYVADFELPEIGSYFVSISPGPGHPPIRTGINVPYSHEFRDDETNDALLTEIAALAPPGGKRGELIRVESTQKMEPGELIRRFNPFRFDLPVPDSIQGPWHVIAWLGACLFFFDVLNRRVQLNLDPVARLAHRAREMLLQRTPPSPADVTISRLRARKAEVDESLDQRRSAARFDLATDGSPAGHDVLEEQEVAPERAPVVAVQPSMGPDKQQASFTEQLLKAKKKVWDDRGESLN